MKRFLALTLPLALALHFTHAQEPAPEGLPLIPETLEPAKKPKPAPQAAAKSSTEKTADALQARIHFREVRTKALLDPQFQVLWDRAHATRTDAERRHGLKAYYVLLYDRMVKIDPSVKPRVEELRKTPPWKFGGGRNKKKVEEPDQAVTETAGE